MMVERRNHMGVLSPELCRLVLYCVEQVCCTITVVAKILH